jgi:uncharacterized DUF497 family protein
VLVDIEFDADKDRANLAKHGVSLFRAADMVEIIERLDIRRDYGEPRFLMVGLLDGRIHVCAYALRDGVRRIISLRKANRREQHAYRTARQG